jgi:hypothetical protein
MMCVDRDRKTLAREGPMGVRVALEGSRPTWYDLPLVYAAESPSLAKTTRSCRREQNDRC